MFKLRISKDVVEAIRINFSNIKDRSFAIGICHNIVKNKDGKMYVCNSCKGWRNKEHCQVCVKKRSNDTFRKKKRENRAECDVLKKDGTKGVCI
jgi:recombinational DNA repair protein RecR